MIGAGAVLVSGILLAGGSGIVVERCVVDVAGLHADLNGLRIVQLSDFHSSRVGSLEVAALSAARDLAPDLVAFTGDLTVHPEVARQLSASMVGLAPPLGCYAVMGNAEYAGDAEAVARAMTDAGMIVLRNEGRTVRRGDGELWVLGVDDPSTGRSFLEGALLGLRGDEATPRVLLAHFPTVFPQAVHWGIDVVLAGHTHGGQIVLTGSRPMGSMGSEELDKYLRGDFRSGTTWMHVSRGVGTSKIPLRLGSPPEVTLITLRSAEGTARRLLP